MNQPLDRRFRLSAVDGRLQWRRTERATPVSPWNEGEEELVTAAVDMGIRSRQEQGLPPMISDPVFLRRVARAIEPR